MKVRVKYFSHTKHKKKTEAKRNKGSRREKNIFHNTINIDRQARADVDGGLVKGWEMMRHEMKKCRKRNVIASHFLVSSGEEEEKSLAMKREGQLRNEKVHKNRKKKKRLMTLDDENDRNLTTCENYRFTQIFSSSFSFSCFILSFSLAFSFFIFPSHSIVCVVLRLALVNINEICLKVLGRALFSS